MHFIGLLELIEAGWALFNAILLLYWACEEENFIAVIILAIVVSNLEVTTLFSQGTLQFVKHLLRVVTLLNGLSSLKDTPSR